MFMRKLEKTYFILNEKKTQREVQNTRNAATHTPSNLSNSYIPEDLAQVEFCTRRICRYIYVAYIKLCGAWGSVVVKALRY